MSKSQPRNFFLSFPCYRPRIWGIVALLALGLGAVSSALADDFTPRILTAPDGQTMPYELRIPPNYDKNQKYPVILFLHGSGGRGSDNKKELCDGTDWFGTLAFEGPHPCFIVVPQCPTDKQWVDMNWSALSGKRPATPSVPMQLALKCLDQVESEFSTDPNRIYVMGLSMGGYGVWDCVTRFPQRFAAAILTCGGGDESTVNPEVAQVPIWVFHSSNDPVVPVVRDRNMVKAMTDAGGHPRYIENNYLGHCCWGEAWETHDLFDWLFSQNLANRPKVPAVSTVSAPH